MTKTPREEKASVLKRQNKSASQKHRGKRVKVEPLKSSVIAELTPSQTSGKCLDQHVFAHLSSCIVKRMAVYINSNVFIARHSACY